MSRKPNGPLAPPAAVPALAPALFLLFFVAPLNSIAAPGPLISSVSAVSVTSSSATLLWTTNTASDSQVAYGLTSTYASLSALDTALVTSHSVTISGLAASTLYHYQVQSRDSSGSLSTLADFTFITETASGTQGIPIPNGTWTMALTRGVPAQANGWEQLVYVPPLKQSVMFSQYHQHFSEPNMAWVGYNFDTNSWSVLDLGGRFHSENIGEGGETQGYFGYNSNNQTIISYCCTSGSNQPEDAFHTWWYDVLGQSGLDKHTSPKPVYDALQPASAFDQAHNLLIVHGGDSFAGTWTYNPSTNAWAPVNPGGTPPDASLILAGMDYSTAAGKVYLFGGFNGTTYSNDIYYYDAAANTWTLINPAGGIKPPARYRHAFAYDSTNNIFLLYGGQNGSTILSDTWVFDPSANAWTQLNPAQSPTVTAAAIFAKLSYDSDHNVFVLAQQGQNGYFGGNSTAFAFQTWLFRYAGGGPNAGTSLPNAQPSTGSINRNLASWAKEPEIGSSGGSLYLAWSETGSTFARDDSYWPHIYVDQYSSGSWSALGTSFESVTADLNEGHTPYMTVIGGVPWVSWGDANSAENASQIGVKSWNGSAWTGGDIGLVGSASLQGRSQIDHIGTTPFTALVEIDKSYFPQNAFAYVKTWNGSAWNLLGGPLNRNSGSGSTADSISITNDGTNPYVAWTEYVHTYGSTNTGDTDTNPQVYVSYWNGSSWAPLGGRLNVDPSAWAYEASIAYLNGAPYVAWTERSQTGNPQVYVAGWNGSAWTLVGSSSLNRYGSAGWAYRPRLVADPASGNLYVAWVEQAALGQKAQVYVSQYAGGTWTALGGPLNADPVLGSAQHVSLGIYNGQPVAAWGEVNSGSLRQIFVKLWNGTNWSLLRGDGGAPIRLLPPLLPVSRPFREPAP